MAPKFGRAAWRPLTCGQRGGPHHSINGCQAETGAARRAGGRRRAAAVGSREDVSGEGRGACRPALVAVPWKPQFARDGGWALGKRPLTQFCAAGCGAHVTADPTAHAEGVASDTRHRLDPVSSTVYCCMSGCCRRARAGFSCGMSRPRSGSHRIGVEIRTRACLDWPLITTAAAVQQDRSIPACVRRMLAAAAVFWLNSNADRFGLSALVGEPPEAL
jgi:hypothetical protein